VASAWAVAALQHSCECRLGIELRLPVFNRFVGDVLAAAFDDLDGGC
jgi:hypothetical protein